jgi:Na+/H+-dicarboxylate symporter
MDMARTALNVVGNALAVLVISKWEKQYDSENAKPSSGIPTVCKVANRTTNDTPGTPAIPLEVIIKVIIVGNALAVLVISKWEKQYDSEKAAAYEATFK